MPDSVISHTWTIAAHRVLVLPDPDRRPAHLGEAAVGVAVAFWVAGELEDQVPGVGLRARPCSEHACQK